MKNDLPPVAAIATGHGPAAIGVVRLSGAGSHVLAMRLCPGLASPPPERKLTLVHLAHPVSRDPLDEALIAWFLPGASYTGEEAVEFYCHGGVLILQRVLSACLDAGAVLAGPGEFTRRAVLNGRLDLAQAEAVAMLADAPTDGAVRVALRQLSGEPSREVRGLVDQLTDLLAMLEAALDFDEEDGVVVDPESLVPALDAARRTLTDWLAAARAARPCLSGFRIALLGPPNAGKSSLFNAIVGQQRAIVHERPGTTRDVVGEAVALGGVSCMVWDTAGLRVAADEVEAEGVTRAKAAAAVADCTLLCLDGSAPLPPGLDDLIPRTARCVILVLTKADRSFTPPQVPDALRARVLEIHATSVRDGRGVDELRGALSALAMQALDSADTSALVVTGTRQEEAVLGALRDLDEAIADMRAEAPPEVVASRLRSAVERLGEVTGRTVTEDVLGRIFSRFCVGK